MTDKILKSFDVWITAQGWKSKLRLRSVDNVSLEGISRLRDLIFELAIRGKLVPQNPNDEPAKVLVTKIFKEKERLVNAGKIKRQEPLSDIEKNEISFDLPAAWIWTKLGNISSNVHYGYTASANENNRDVRMLRITDIQNDSVDWDTVPGCDIDDKNVSDYLLENGDILIARTGGTIGKSYLVSNITLKSVFASYLIRVKKLDAMYPNYIKVFLGSKLYWDQLIKNSMGTGQPNVNGSALKNLTIPLPPLEEQQRIVAKVDELMALCDELEQQETNHLKSHQLLVETLLGTLIQAKDASEFQNAWATLAQHVDDLFITDDSIDQLKQTILQLAVMGKLVPQDPKDEPASLLLKTIENEKQGSVKGGNKKQKQLPALNDEEKFFNLPKDWVWCRFGVLGEFINGDRSANYPNKSEYVDNGIPWINTGHIEPDGTLSTVTMNYITQEKFDSLKSGKILPNDLVYCLRGATFGKTAFVSPYTQGAIASSLMIIRLSKYLNSRFVYYYLRSPFAKQQLERFDNGSAQPNLAANDVVLYSFPLPPLQTQSRIVAKVDELFALCNRLKRGISDSKKVAYQMAESILEQVDR